MKQWSSKQFPLQRLELQQSLIQEPPCLLQLILHLDAMMISRSKIPFNCFIFLQFSVACIGRKQELKCYLHLQTAQDNIDLQTTILSRFDLIFIVKDIRKYDQDKVRQTPSTLNSVGDMSIFVVRTCFFIKKLGI